MGRPREGSEGLAGVQQLFCTRDNEGLLARCVSLGTELQAARGTCVPRKQGQHRMLFHEQGICSRALSQTRAFALRLRVYLLQVFPKHLQHPFQLVHFRSQCGGGIFTAGDKKQKALLAEASTAGFVWHFLTRLLYL